jgi:hypothetical protein
MGAVPKSVPSAVTPSSPDSVKVDTDPQLGPYQPMQGSSVVPAVPRSDNLTSSGLTGQPGYGGTTGVGSPAAGGSHGAPSVPARGFLFTRGPIDPHYTDTAQAADPYRRVNSPATRGMFTFVLNYANHVFNGKQDTDNAGWQQNSPQQRTSVMRVTPPPHGSGYDPAFYKPTQQPQAVNTYKYGPVLGSDPYGSGVLNRDTYGAGQVAGGMGGNTYTPQPGPPDTTVAGTSGSGEPVWG